MRFHTNYFAGFAVAVSALCWAPVARAAIVDPDGDGLDSGDEPALGWNPAVADTDGDGLLDGAEDSDLDGLSDAEELYETLTDPLKADTDGDGLNDFHEVAAFKTDPLALDTDLDGLSDGDEVLAFGTQPLIEDSDGDGLPDGQEVSFYGTLANQADTDGDGLKDGLEADELGTSPLSADTDGDGVADGAEDSDGDGLPDALEANTTGTDPLEPDTDQNGTPDGGEDADADGLTLADELLVHKTDPALPDSDGDGLLDGEEVKIVLTSPLDPDTDDDGLGDAVEAEQGDVDPSDADSDDDGVPDGDEPQWDLDTDGDGLVNAVDPDSDGDGLYDGTELGLTKPHADTVVGLGFFAADADEGRTVTNPLKADTDNAGIDDGEEDANLNGQLDAGESDPADPFDDGAGALLEVTELPVGDPTCPNGGKALVVGFDNGEGEGEPADGKLHADEVDITTVVCNGIMGQTSLTQTTDLAAGDLTCEYGGTRVDAGIDDNGDLQLSPAEIDSTAYVCARKSEVGNWGGGGGGGCQGGPAGSGLGWLVLAAAGLALARRRPLARG